MLLPAPLLALALALAQSPTPPADSAPVPARRMVPLTRETADQRRSSFEKGWPSVEAALKRWSSLDEGPRDFRSVAPAWDIKAYVFTTEQRQTLEARRREAQDQFDGGDWPGAILYYGQMLEQANGVVTRLSQVGSYWNWYTAHQRRMARWRKTVRSNQLANPAGPEIEANEGRLKEQIRGGQFGEASTTSRSEIDRLFKQAVEQARAGAPGGVLRDDPLRRLPDKPCADGQADMPVPPFEAQTAHARLDVRKAKSVGGYYPLTARYSNLEGVVTVRALTSTSGCVVYAEIGRSSGSDLLDDAAMDWTVEAAAFSPAIGADQTPVPSILTFNVRFKLND